MREATATPIDTRGPLRLLDLLGVIALGLVVAMFARLRWVGVEPFGSDNDEYLLVGESIWTTGAPLVAGVEGTKYPVGYPVLVGAVDALGLPSPWALLWLNVALVAVLVAIVWIAARRWGTLPALAAGAVVAMAPSVWDSTYLVMPDVAFVVVVAATMLLAVGSRIGPEPGPPTRAVSFEVALVVLLVVVATLLKSIGLVLGLAVGLHLLRWPEARRWAWTPPSAAAVVLGLQAALVARYPEHTTGYAATFFLRDPFDAALGTVGYGELVERLALGIETTLVDAGRAGLHPELPAMVALFAVALLAAAAVAVWRRQSLALAVFTILFVLALAIWPYRSIRLALPALPVVAAGVAATVWLAQDAVRYARRERSIVDGSVGIVVVALLVAFGWWSASHVSDAAEVERHRLVEIHAATESVSTWIDANVAEDETLASFDYRELALRLDRVVLPVSYTSDPVVLWAQTGGAGADWLIAVRGLYHGREARLHDLLAAWPERFELVHDVGRVEVYAVRSDRP